MFFNYIFILIFISIESVYAQSISVSIEPRFAPFIKKVEKNQTSYTLKIQKRNTSFDVFKDIKKGKALLAIVRGDILVDNRELKKFQIISKLKLPTYLYLVSKNGVNNAYDLLNSDEKKDGVKHISVGYLNDLANIYLKDIAKNVYSQYSFRYKYFPPKESFQKLKEGKIDAAYLFLSPFLVEKAKKMKFKLQKIVKAKNRTNLSKKLESQKAFKVETNGIRIDNYLISSSSISRKMLKSLLSSLKKQGLLLTNISKDFGKLDSRIKGISKKIDREIKQAKKIALQKEKAKKIERAKKIARQKEKAKKIERAKKIARQKEKAKKIEEAKKIARQKEKVKKIEEAKKVARQKEAMAISEPLEEIEHKIPKKKEPTIISKPTPSSSLEREDRGF